MIDINEAQKRFLLDKLLPGAWFGLALAVLSFGLIPFLTKGPMWPLLATGTLSLLTPLGYGIYIWWTGGMIVDVWPSTVYVFQSEDVYVHPHKITQFHRERFTPEERNVLKGTRVKASIEPPQHYYKEDGEMVMGPVGTAHPKEKTVEIGAEKMLTDHHEIELRKIVDFHLDDEK